MLYCVALVKLDVIERFITKKSETILKNQEIESDIESMWK